MSHVATVDLKILSLDELARACETMGVVYDRNATKYRTYYDDNPNYARGVYQSVIPPERFGVADAGVIKVPDALYDIGVYKVPGVEGEYCLVYDQLGGGFGIDDKLGVGLVRLKERYGANVATKQLKSKGFRVAEERDQQTNRLRLVATRSRF